MLDRVDNRRFDSIDQIKLIQITNCRPLEFCFEVRATSRFRVAVATPIMCFVLRKRLWVHFKSFVSHDGFNILKNSE